MNNLETKLAEINNKLASDANRIEVKNLISKIKLLRNHLNIENSKSRGWSADVVNGLEAEIKQVTLELASYGVIIDSGVATWDFGSLDAEDILVGEAV